MDVEEDILHLETRDHQGFKKWIVDTMTQWIDDPAHEINPDHDFADCSLDSVAALRLLGMLEIIMKQPMDPSLFSKYPTPTLLAGYLSDLAEIS